MESIKVYMKVLNWNNQKCFFGKHNKKSIYSKTRTINWNNTDQKITKNNLLKHKWQSI